MDPGIIVAIITGVLSLVGVIFTSVSNRKKISADFQRNAELADARLDSQIKVINAHLENLGEEVRKHNSFGSRIPVLEEKIQSLERRIDKLERG